MWTLCTLASNSPDIWTESLLQVVEWMGVRLFHVNTVYSCIKQTWYLNREPFTGSGMNGSAVVSCGHCVLLHQTDLISERLPNKTPFALPSTELFDVSPSVTRASLDWGTLFESQACLDWSGSSVASVWFGGWNRIPSQPLSAALLVVVWSGLCRCSKDTVMDALIYALPMLS